MHMGGNNLNNLHMFMSTKIISTDTQKLIKIALPHAVPLEGQPRITDVQPWPGTTFEVNDDEEEAMALLGTLSSYLF
jgi:hypothetical protein